MLNNSKITTLFLDIGGVLLSDGWGHDFRRQAAGKFHLDEQDMETRHKIMFVTQEEGKISLNEYLDHVVFYKPRDFTYSEFRNFMFSLSTADWEMISFIKNLKTKNALKIVAISNEARELNAYRIQAFKLKEVFDFFISSCFIQVRKPDQAIFKMALDTAQVSAEEVVYIDDVQTFTDIAADLGIHSIHHTSRNLTSAALTTFGLQTEERRQITVTI